MMMADMWVNIFLEPHIYSHLKQEQSQYKNYNF